MKRALWGRLRWAAVWLVGLLLVACGRLAVPDQQPAELRVGLLATLSGTAAETAGKSTVEGAQLAVKRANDAGGIAVGGRRQHVTLIVEDDQDAAEAAIDAARKLITQQSV